MQPLSTASGVVLAMTLEARDGVLDVIVEKQHGPACVVHWGLVRDAGGAWQPPPSSALPPGSTVTRDAVDTPLSGSGDRLTLRLDPAWRFHALALVLFVPETSRWDNNHGRNYWIDLPVSAPPAQTRVPLPQDTGLAELAERIVASETGRGSWTLMHRFNLARELLERIPADSTPGLALLFVWLRFSALRQLDWQRNYNTQPRDLAHAQDRLTHALAERAAGSPAQRPLVRMIATTVGRGGDGQRVRDGILEIMHRHHVKEVSGHFLEEWHQKLHNNTTPDDVVICEAYLAFLRGGGDQSAFQRTLEAGGVTRERLASYERPIRSQPDDVPGLRDALVRDFADFLGVLRSVHAATDFGTALAAARGALDQETRGLLDQVWARHGEATSAAWLLDAITRARETLATQLHPGRPGLRDLLYLDLALEDLLRTVVERHLHEPRSVGELVTWTELALRNLLCARTDDELALCLAHLRRLSPDAQHDREWALHVQAVLDRSRRALVAISDHDFGLLQPLAARLGTALHAQPWTVTTFAEEALRGRIDFVLSALLRKLGDGLRAVAKTGDWQLASRGSGQAHGVVRIADALADAQTGRLDASTLLVAARVDGSEEIPANVVAVLTETSVDLMSHLAVRARNAGVLLATCSAADLLAELRAKAGQWLRLSVGADGEVRGEAAEAPSGAQATKPETVVAAPPPKPTSAGPYLLVASDFVADNVGAKSRNLEVLRARLPESIAVPRGIAVPYGTCERVLAHPLNRERGARVAALGAMLPGPTHEASASILAELRELVRGVLPPADFEPAFRAALAGAEMTAPTSFAEAWGAIAQVWASKWNDRAYLSRRAHGQAESSLAMAVLIQEVVPAEYAFVMHTANPITGDRDELVAEVVPGLGETLVGNHPGRAFGFRWQRTRRTAEVTSFPSKSLGLFGEGLVFRSDSSGEDLGELAGAGLYDSYMVPPARAVRLDYGTAELLWDAAGRARFMAALAEVGVAVEAAFGSPQDIEGVYANRRFTVVQARPQVGLPRG